MEIDHLELANIIKEAADYAVTKALIDHAVIPGSISQAKAYTLFDKARVKSWVDMGLISRIKQGEGCTSVKYDFLKLKELDMNPNRALRFRHKRLTAVK